MKQNRPSTTANDVETLNFDLSAANASEAEDRDQTMVCHRQFQPYTPVGNPKEMKVLHKLSNNLRHNSILIYVYNNYSIPLL